MFCQKCGKQIPDDARFCPNCGYNGGNQSAQNDMSAQQSDFSANMQTTAPLQQPIPTEKKGKKTGVIIGAVAGGVVIVVLAVVLMVVLLGEGGEIPSSETDNHNNDSFGSYETTSADDTDLKISKDYHSGEIIIDGDLITIPTKASDLMALGWAPKGFDADYVIEAHASNYDGKWDGYFRNNFYKGSSSIDTVISNRTDQNIKLEDGYVTRLITDEDSDYSVIIPGGFETSSSTKDAIASVWGKPDSEISISSEMYECKYEIGDYGSYSLVFHSDNDVLVYAEIYSYDPAIIPTSPRRINTINLNAAKALKDKDSFEVKVTKMQISEGYYNTGNINLVGNDAFVVTVTNNGDKDLTGVEILTVGYKDDGELIKIESGISIPVPGSEKYISVITNDGDFSIKSGETGNIALRCDARIYFGAEALIYSYTDANGQKHVNPLAKEWCDSIYER